MPTWDGKALAFLALVDLTDLGGFEADVTLPDVGCVNFFYEADEQQAWGFEPSHREGWRVIYTPPGEARHLSIHRSRRSPRASACERQALTVPGWEEPAVEELAPPHRPRPTSGLAELRSRRTRQREEQQREAYYRFLDEWSEVIDLESTPNHQVGGWPRLQQGPIWKECAVVSQGLPLGTSEQWSDPRVPALEQQSSDWRLFLQLDTDDEAGWMWGDVGTLYFATRCSIAVPTAFDHAWMVFQCG